MGCSQSQNNVIQPQKGKGKNSHANDFESDDTIHNTDGLKKDSEKMDEDNAKFQSRLDEIWAQYDVDGTGVLAEDDAKDFLRESMK